MWKVLCNSFPHSQILLDLRATLIQKAAGGWVSSVLRLCKFLCLASVEMEASLLSLDCEARSSSHRHSILISNVHSLVAVVVLQRSMEVGRWIPTILSFRASSETRAQATEAGDDMYTHSSMASPGQASLENCPSVYKQEACPSKPCVSLRSAPRLPGRMGKSFLFKCHHDYLVLWRQRTLKWGTKPCSLANRRECFCLIFFFSLLVNFLHHD